MRFIRPLLTLAIFFVPATGFAQAAINGTASAGRAQIEAPAQQPAFQPPPAAHVSVQPTRAINAPPGAEKIHFVLHDIRLSGVSVYHREDLTRFYAQLIGKDITLADIYRVAANLTRKYRNDGYVLTQVVVPPQTIEGGHVTLRVVEGYIDNVQVHGSDNPRAADLIEAYARRVHGNGSALNIRDLESAMLLINDLPGVSAQGVLSPSPTKVGAADLLVTYTRKMFNGQVGVDNYGSRFLGPYEGSAALSLNSVLGLNEKITGQVVYAPGHDLHDKLLYGGLDYEQPVFDYGTSVEGFLNDTETNPRYLLKDFDVNGHAVDGGIRIKQPIIRTRDLSVTARLTGDYDNVSTNDDLGPSTHDYIRSVRLGGRVEYVDSFVTAAHSFLDLEASHGLDILAANGNSDIDTSHPGAKPNYTKFAGEAQRLQMIVPDVNLLLGVEAQYSPSTLFTAEELGVGGINYGRGYDPSQLVGDSGVAGKAELQWNEPVKFADMQRFLANYQVFGFYDAGRVWNHSATTSAEARASLASTGFGLRSDFVSGTSGSVLAAFPLTRGVSSEDDKHDVRVLANLNQRF